MATLAKPQPSGEPFHHRYYATAGILSATIEQPLQSEVKDRVLRLPYDGEYQFRLAEPFRLEGIISYESGYAQVAGFASRGGFTTLATSVVEGLNILDVVTADRVVGQISTKHPRYDDGQVPSVTFLGTRFDNLRINGHKIEVTRCLDILGPKPAGDKSYFEDEVVLGKISEQNQGLPAWAREHWTKSAIQDITQPAENTAHCSLVSKVEGAPGITFGHVIDLPHFGKIFLAELTVHRKKEKLDASKSELPDHDTYSFHLTMIRAKMGSIAKGDIDVSPLDTNGGGKGGPTPPPPPPPELA